MSVFANGDGTGSSLFWIRENLRFIDIKVLLV